MSSKIKSPTAEQFLSLVTGGKGTPMVPAECMESPVGEDGFVDLGSEPLTGYVILCAVSDYGTQPIRLLGADEVRVEDLNAMAKSYPGCDRIIAYPIRTTEQINICGKNARKG